MSTFNQHQQTETSVSKKLTMTLIKHLKFTLLWSLLYISVRLAYGETLSMLIVAAGIIVLLIPKTRAYSPIYGDYLYAKKVAARKEGNTFLRQLGLVKASDFESYNVSLIEGQDIVQLVVTDPINGISSKQVYETCVSQKDRKNAVTVTNELTGKGSQVVTFHLVDPLTGTRHAEITTPTNTPTIGRCASGGEATINLVDASHIIVQGQTRSGKSHFLRVLLAHLAGENTVQVWGIDPGTSLLAPVAEATNAERFSLGYNPETTYKLLQKLVDSMDSRLHTLRTQKMDKFEEFSESMPLIVVVLDEYAGIIRQLNDYDSDHKPAERLSAKAKALINRLVAEGAKVGFRVVVSTQRADTQSVDGSIRAQFATRFTFNVDNADAVRMLHPNATEAAEDVAAFPPGRALMRYDRTTETVQVDMLSYKEYRGIWERL